MRTLSLLMIGCGIVVIAQGVASTQEKKPAPDVDKVVSFFLVQYDTNKDEKISKDEAKNRLADGFGSLDANKDGYLDRKELRVAAEKMLAFKKGPPGKFPFQPGPPDFDALDKDADGRLTKEELKNTVWLNRLAEVDTSDDGRIDRREWDAYLEKQQKKKEAEEKDKKSE